MAALDTLLPVLVAAIREATDRGVSDAGDWSGGGAP
jgi:hypothetical protein